MNEYYQNELRECFNPLPGIITYDTEVNPTIHSPSAEYDIPFYITKEYVMDIDLYRNFIKNCVYRFRRSRYYKQYKAYLMDLGLDRSQILGNIDDTMADIEMHHAILTIFDITLMITEHLLNTVGRATSFDVIQLLIEEHHQNNIPIVMLDKTSHEMLHSDMDNFLPPNQVFGRFWNLVYKYRYGVSMEVAKKLLSYISRYYRDYPVMNVQVREDIMNFSKFNEFIGPYNESQAIEGQYTEM